MVIKIPPHLAYVATLPCNLSLMACFADINVSQGSVAYISNVWWDFNNRLTANLPRNLPVKKFLKSVTVWQNYGDESVAPFFGPPRIYLRPNQKPNQGHITPRRPHRALVPYTSRLFGHQRSYTKRLIIAPAHTHGNVIVVLVYELTVRHLLSLSRNTLTAPEDMPPCNMMLY